MDITPNRPTEKEIQSHFASIGIDPPSHLISPISDADKTKSYFASVGQEAPKYIQEVVKGESNFSSPVKVVPTAKQDTGNTAPLNSNINDEGRIVEQTVTVSELMAIVAELKQTFVTSEEARAIAAHELPEEFRSLSATRDNTTGNVLKLIASDVVGRPSQAQWGAVDAAGGTGGDTADWAFKYVSAVGAVATFNGGPVIKGTSLAYTITSPQAVTITATGQIVYVSYTFGGSASFGVANADNFPLSASGTFVKALQSFAYVKTGDGESLVETITPLLTYHRGVIQIDGCYS